MTPEPDQNESVDPVDLIQQAIQPLEQLLVEFDDETIGRTSFSNVKRAYQLLEQSKRRTKHFVKHVLNEPNHE